MAKTIQELASFLRESADDLEQCGEDFAGDKAFSIIRLGEAVMKLARAEATLIRGTLGE